MAAPPRHAPRDGGGRLVLSLALLLATLITLLIGAAILRAWLDPLARQQAAIALDAQAQAAAALPIWLDVAVLAAWRVLPPLLVGAAGVVALRIAWRRWGWPEFIQAAHATRQARAQAQRFPEGLSSLSFHASSRHDLAALPAPTAVEAEIVPDAPPALPAGAPGRPLLATLRDCGHICRSGRSLLAGYADGTPRYVELPGCGFIAVAGQPRAGKSSVVTLLLAQAIMSGWHVALCDPHIHKADGLIARARPLSGHLLRQAATPDEVAATIRYVDKIGRARVNGDADRTPVILVIDEFSNFVIRGLLPDDVLGALPAMAMEYAGVNVHGIVIGHDWSKSLLGGELGAAFRRAITHRIVCRSDPQTAEFLLPSAALARQAAGLGVGQALCYGPDGAAVISIPWIGEADLVYAAAGRPERPYAPWPAERLLRMPRTARVAPVTVAPARPSVPTEPIVMTVPTQIGDLLNGRRSAWLTAAEIADALGLDVQVVRTELTPLVDRGMLRRRPTRRRGREQYEYSINATLNGPIVPAA